MTLNNKQRNLLALVLAIPYALMVGATTSKLWAWFVVTTLGLNPLSIPAALGLSLVLSMLRLKAYSWIDSEAQARADDEDRTIMLIVHVPCSCAMALIMGYIIHLFL